MDTPAEKLTQYIDNFIDYIYNNIETMYGIEHDNEHEPIVIPSNLYYSCYGLYYANLTGVDFSASWWHGGTWSILYSFDVTFANGDLRYGGFAEVGRYNKSDWDAIDTIPEYGVSPDAAYNILHGYIESNEQMYVYSSEPESTPYTYTATIDGAYNCPKFMFAKNNNYGAVYSRYQGGDGQLPDISPTGTLFSSQYINLYFWAFDFIDEGDGYIVADTGLNAIPTSYLWSRYGDGLLVTKLNDTSVINNYITNNGADHNYTYTYETENGDEVTVYYGDNYVIYKADDDAEITYNDNYNIINKIKDDTDLPINNPTYHDKKYGPEPEPVTDDDYIDMGLGVETDGMAMYNMAVVTRDDLIQLITDFETNADTGLSFIPHVLGLYKLGIESSQLLTTKSEQIKLHKEPNGTSAFTSVENYNIVDEQLQVIDCGSITVDREELLTNTFYDYSPYSTYEMFIPGCGWITLPDTIVGRTISVYIVFDLTTCSCKGIVRSEGKLIGGSGTTLATVNGIIGSSVPLSINETGLQRAAIFNGSTQAAMALGTAFLGVGIGNPYMGASGVAMAAGALADNHVAGNTTYTNTKGGATDYSIFGDGYKAVLKITRPQVEIPDNYGHTVGFVVNEYGVLSDYHGFTVCINPHIHISATSDEKEEIKRLLESGVILPDGEDE